MGSFAEVLKGFKILGGAVLLDLDFVFSSDGTRTPKWIIILSDNFDENIIFTLTTSQLKTYSGSYRQHIVVKHGEESCFDKDCIIEIERTDTVDPEKILAKYKAHRLIHKGFISKKLMDRIIMEIAECDVIPDHIKESICRNF